MNTSLVTINGENAVVSLDTIIKFSGNDQESVRRLVRDNKETLVELGLSYTKESKISNPDILNETELTYSELIFTESASAYLITLMSNKKQVKKFKLRLVNDFYKAKKIIKKLLADKLNDKQQLIQAKQNLIEAKDEIIKEKDIEIDKLKKEIERLQKSGMRFYGKNNATTSVSNCKKILKIEDMGVTEINNALQWFGYLVTYPIVTIKRDVAPAIQDLDIAYSEKKFGLPTFKPEVVKKAVDAYREAGMPQVSIDLNFIRELERKLNYYKHQLIKS